MKKIIVLIAMLTVVACVPSFQLKEVGEADMWGSYTVAVVEDLNELKTDSSIMWTQDGPILEAIEFWKPVSDGGVLPINYNPTEKDKAPAFRSDMTPEEIVELVRSSFRLTSLIPTKFENLRPQNFGTKKGYIVDAELSSQKGDDFRSQLLFSNTDGSLYVVYFTGRATHYFDARKPVFDKIVASIQF